VLGVLFNLGGSSSLQQPKQRLLELIAAQVFWSETGSNNRLQPLLQVL
jgi:hypothetical protein